MASDQARQLRLQGIAAAKAGQKEEARKLLQQSIRLEPNNEAAWLWMASIASERRERLFCLQKLLEINPNNQAGLQALKGLGMTREQLAEQTGQTPAPTATAATPADTQTPGVPIPDGQRVAEAQNKVDFIVREYLAPVKSGVTWTRKTKRRAGERDVIVLRAYVAAGAIALLVILGVVSATVVTNTPELASALFGPSDTPTFTPAPPTLTPTNTPGVTPTPSPTPELTLTPSATVPPEIRGAPSGVPPTATDIYPPVSERTIRGAIVFLDQGNFGVAQPTLAAERELTGARFNPVPFYYEAVSWVQAGDSDRALRVLQEAETRVLDEELGEGTMALIDTGFALVNLQLALDAQNEGDSDAVTAYLAVVEQRAEDAITADPLLAQPYLLLARRHSFSGDYDEALGVIDRGLEVPQLSNNVYLIVEKGNIYLRQNEIDLAAYQAFLALYIDPVAESAHVLRIQAALAQNDPGLAVIYSQQYLFYYPGSVQGYTLLGDARVREGNTDLALAAYDQALQGEDTNPFLIDALISRANIYNEQRRYDLAREDLTRALQLSEDNPAFSADEILRIQAARMQAAYDARNFATAQEDADDLLGSGVLADAEIQLLQARILVDEASGDGDYSDALDLLTTISGALPASLQPIADEYRARAHFNLSQNGDALNAIDRALAGGETGSRHYLRGQILEEMDEPEEALREYEWVLTWGEVYPYSFLPDVQARVEALRED